MIRRLLIASSNRLFADAASAFFEHKTGWRSVGSFSDGIQALAAVGRLHPSCVLVIGDDLPRLASEALAGQIRRRFPGIAVVIVGNRDAAEASVIPSSVDSSGVVAALSKGPPVPSPPARDTEEGVSGLKSLTPRERLTMKLLADGNTREQIAGHLGVSTHTVRTHIQNLYAKMGFHNRVDLVSYAARHGLIAPETLRNAGGRS